MEFVKKREPYEILFRIEGGKLAGAHIECVDRVYEDGILISEKLSGALPIELAEGLGFPISDISSILNLSFLKTAQEAISSVNIKNQEIEMMKAQEGLTKELLQAAMNEINIVKSDLQESRKEVIKLGG